MKLAIRPFNPEQDQALYITWHLDRAPLESYDRGIPKLPTTSFVVIDVDSKVPLAMGGFIRTDYHGLAIPEAYAAEPKVSKEVRAIALNYLNKQLMAMALEEGFTNFMGITAVNSLKDHGILFKGKVYGPYCLVIGDLK